MFVGASAAWHLLRGNNTPAIRKMFSMAMWMALLVAPIQAFVGDMHGLNTLEHQPAKIAAIEGHWENKPGEATPLLLFGIPDMEEERTKYGLEIPALGSLILTHSLDKQVPALKDFPKENRPNSLIVFWSFRIMVGMGVLMIALGVWSLWLRYQQRLFHSRLPVVRPGDGAGRTAGAVGRLDHDRSGTSALGHLWFFTDPGCGIAAQHGANGRQPAGLYRGVLFGLWRRLLLHCPAY